MESGASPNPRNGAEELSGYLTRRDKEFRKEQQFQDQSLAEKPPYAIKDTYGGVRGGESPLLARPTRYAYCGESPRRGAMMRNPRPKEQVR